MEESSESKECEAKEFRGIVLNQKKEGHMKEMQFK